MLVANLPTILFSAGATFVSLFGLNANTGFVFWGILLAPLWLAIWLAGARSLRPLYPGLACAMAAFSAFAPFLIVGAILLFG
ncbi:hypothetical protein [Stakelama tenebrarum]|uniref:Uncharacterized protein n=1 Tax=Stakelama tenebrarum TaxID=2711215 RepID=A0A6G6Y099_9SPHN|nr:hypothetical protein [Sphingosinithalassobacter tenebrarum]QIG78345.1 hypothetical protein G5C33_00065 [Sphingosinithalassobacter tenebrarum]